MSVTLPPEVELRLKDWVERGDYADEAAVIMAALELLDEQARFQRFQDSLVEADAQIERGETAPWSPELLERLKREGDEMARRGEQPDPDVCP